MENSPQILTTPVSLIILPASSGNATLQTLQPLTVITTNALNTSLQSLATSFSTNVVAFPATCNSISPFTTASTTTTTSNNNTTKPTTTTSGATKRPSGTPPLKPAKKFRQEQEEILRCKRKLEFVGSMGIQGPQPGTVLRRNERERNRVKLINNTFLRLREHLPSNTVKTSKGKAKKLSKVDTLQRAIDYIGNLQQLIDEHDAVESVFDGSLTGPSFNVNQQAGSVGSSPVSPATSTASTLHSPGSTGDAENLSDSASVSPEEEDLLDFTSWF